LSICVKSIALVMKNLPPSLRSILDSLQRELNRIERVLKKCSGRKGIKGFLLRKDLLTKIKQCDVELSNVLQAFQAELLLDVRFAQVEAGSYSGPIEATATIPQELNGPRIFLGTKNALDALWRLTLNPNREARSLLPRITRSHAALFFFFQSPMFL